jgi:Tfp pilus assembly protein PilF
MTTHTVAQAMESAQAHLQAGRLSEAERACRGALALKGDDAQGHAMLGVILRRQGRHGEAVAAYERALQLKPDWPEVLNNLGNALLDNRLPHQAVAAFKRALDLRPTMAEAFNNLGNVLRQLGMYEEAAGAYRRSLALAPQSLDARNNIGGALSAAGKFEEAAKIHRQIIVEHPKFAPAHWDLSLILLRDGDYGRGWEEYEWRWGVADLRLGERLKSRQWVGEELNGKTIVVYAEQGLGDAIQFARFVPMVAARGGRVVLVCRKELMPVFERVAGVAQCVTTVPEHEVSCPLLSLAGVLGIRLENLPKDGAYIAADEATAKKWAERFAGERRRKVGVVWAGRTYPDPLRSVPLAEMARLAEVADACWVSLQTGDAAFETRPGNFSMMDCGKELKNFGETAGLMANLDLIVTIDTAAAHLAGAMGKPALVLLKHAADWRWMRDRADCPWYPTLRLFRQPRAGDWQTPIGEVIRAMRAP